MVDYFSHYAPRFDSLTLSSDVFFLLPSMFKSNFFERRELCREVCHH